MPLIGLKAKEPNLYFVLVINASTAPSQPVLDYQEPKLKYIKQSFYVHVNVINTVTNDWFAQLFLADSYSNVLHYCNKQMVRIPVNLRNITPIILFNHERKLYGVMFQSAQNYVIKTFWSYINVWASNFTSIFVKKYWIKKLFETFCLHFSIKRQFEDFIYTWSCK